MQVVVYLLIQTLFWMCLSLGFGVSEGKCDHYYYFKRLYFRR